MLHAFLQFAIAVRTGSPALICVDSLPYCCIKDSTTSYRRSISSTKNMSCPLCFCTTGLNHLWWIRQNDILSSLQAGELARASLGTVAIPTTRSSWQLIPRSVVAWSLRLARIHRPTMQHLRLSLVEPPVVYHCNYCCLDNTFFPVPVPHQFICSFT